MKTLFQYLWEIDDEKLFALFCAEYESKIFCDVEFYNYIDEMTVREIRQKYKEIFFSYLERLRHTRPKRDTGKIFIFHEMWGQSRLFDVKLISLEELALYDLCAGQELSYPDLSEALGSYVGDTKIVSSSVYSGIAMILYKLSEVGYSQEEIDEAKRANDEFLSYHYEEHNDGSYEKYAFEDNECSEDAGERADEETSLRRALTDAENEINKLFMRKAYEKNLEILEKKLEESCE